MNHLPTPILSKDMTISDIPIDIGDWSAMVAFAATFRPQDEIPDCSKIRGLSDITESSEISDIRAALFAEWRRYNHFGCEPEEHVFTEAKQAIELLRNKL